MNGRFWARAGIFKVLAIEPEHALVIGSVEAVDEGVFEGFKQMFPAFTWVFVLEAVDGEQTRLISRFCGQSEPSQSIKFVAKFAAFISEPIEFVMTRKMLLGIKQRAERLPAGEPVKTEAQKNGTVTSTANV